MSETPAAQSVAGAPPSSDLIGALAKALAPHMADAVNAGPSAFKAAGWSPSPGFKHDATGTPIAVGYSHGDGGNFSYPGVQPDVFHTIVGSRGLLGVLPARGSIETNPTYSILTGVQDDTGTEPDAPCDDAPTAGLAKNGILTSVFGRYTRATAEIDISRIGKVIDRADPMDLTMVGSPITQAGIFASGPGNAAAPNDVLTNETSRKFWELGVSLHRLLSVQLWTGTPANNTGAGGYKEMTGIDLLVTTGHVDAESGAALPSADSQVNDFNFQRVDSFGTELVNILTYQYRFVKNLADATGVSPVNFAFVMREELFYEITAVWPCAYLTYRCEVEGNERVNVDGAEQARMRDEMRNGSYLLIDGTRVPVIVDPGIAVDTSTTSASVTEGCSASTVYLLPLSVLGGRSTLFLEHFDYSNPSAASALAGTNMALARVNGPFITTPKQTNLCIQWQSLVEPRCVLRTPWLAARLDNVMYCPTINVRQPFPNDPYFVDGGATSRPGPSLSTLWS